MRLGAVGSRDRTSQLWLWTCVFPTKPCKRGHYNSHFIPRITITNLLHVDGTLDPALASKECTVVGEILQRWVSPLAEDRVKPGVAKQGTLTRDRAGKSHPQLVTSCSASAMSDLCYQNIKASWVALCPLKNNTVCLVYAFSSPQSWAARDVFPEWKTSFCLVLISINGEEVGYWESGALEGC